MNGIYLEDLDSLLDGADLADFEERRRGRTAPVRTPSQQSSFRPRPGPSVASQGQVQAAAQNLDSKIETLSNAIKALETRTTTLAAEQDRVGVALRKEVEERKKSADAVRADLQQTKTLAVLLPLLTQETVEATDSATGKSVRVVTQSQNQLASILPFFLLFQPPAGGDGARPLGGDSTMSMLLPIMLLTKR